VIILGSTDRRAPAGFAPIAIGFALTLIHLIGIPVTNLSVNPAQHRAGRVRRRLGTSAAVALLGRAARRRGGGRNVLSKHGRGVSHCFYSHPHR
jgi:glycerol uptake facilitator-like aquaporin